MVKANAFQRGESITHNPSDTSSTTAVTSLIFFIHSDMHKTSKGEEKQKR